MVYLNHKNKRNKHNVKTHTYFQQQQQNAMYNKFDQKQRSPIKAVSSQSLMNSKRVHFGGGNSKPLLVETHALLQMRMPTPEQKRTH